MFRFLIKGTPLKRLAHGVPIGALLLAGQVAVVTGAGRGIGRAIATALLWGRNTTSFGVVSADNFGLFVTAVLILLSRLV